MSPSVAFFGLPLRIALLSGDGWETVLRAATSSDELPEVLTVEEAAACASAAVPRTTWPDSGGR